MQQSNALDITFDDRIAGDRKAQATAEIVRRQFRMIRDGLRRIPLRRVGRTPMPVQPPLSGYYAGAAERARMSMPALSLDQITTPRQERTG